MRPVSEGKLVKTLLKPKNVKAALKIATFFGSMLAFGALHKLDNFVKEKIEEHYA